MGLKNLSLKRYGFIEMGGQKIAISTVGFSKRRDTLRDLKRTQKIPTKVTPPNNAEKSAMESLGYKITNGMPLVISRLDETSTEYIEFKKSMDRYELFIKIATNLDMNYEYDGIELWKELELTTNKDYLGVIDWLEGLEMSEANFEYLNKAIDLISNSKIKSYKEWIEKVDEKGV